MKTILEIKNALENQYNPIRKKMPIHLNIKEY
jgi:hypothetical protein